MSYATANGYTIIPVPSSPVPRDVTISMNDTVAQTVSPFTLQPQFQYWAGADFWEMDVTLPPMQDSAARPWMAWFGSLRGKTNIFQMGDPTRTSTLGTLSSLLGTVSGYPTANGNFIPGATLISLAGLPANQAALLVPGDYLQCGFFLHMIAGVNPIASNSSGVASNIEIWPSLRASVTSGQSFPCNYTQGIWRLVDNKRSMPITSPAHLWTFSFKAVEAR